jgi:hypothetical protein
VVGCVIVLAGVVAATAGRRERKAVPVPSEEVASWT